jgi:microfibrillar-associated protein 1
MKEKLAVNEMDSDAAELTMSSGDDNAKELAYSEWKARELKRLLRDRQELRAHEEEEAEILRRRNITDLERQEENLRLGNDNNMKKQKVAYNFMQKFYSKGAFFQGDD